MRYQKKAGIFGLFCLLVLVFPLSGYAQPSVTFYSAYLNQTKASGGFGDQIWLQLFMEDGREVQERADLSILRINGKRYDDAQEACAVLENAGAIQLALDEVLQIVRIDFTPLQAHLTGQMYDTAAGGFQNTAFDDNLPIFYMVGGRSDNVIFTTPYLADGYVYDLDVYGDGVVITQMKKADGSPYIRALTTNVATEFERKTIEVTAFPSNVTQPFSLTTTSPLGFSVSQTIAPGEDTASIVYDSNQEDLVTITAAIADVVCWETTVALHKIEIQTAVINRMTEGGAGSFDECVELEIFDPNGARKIVTIDDATRINGRRYDTVEGMMAILKDAAIIQFMETKPGRLGDVRFDTEPLQAKKGIAYTEISQELPVFYRYSDAIRQPFAPPYLADGYVYDTQYSAYGTIITNMSFAGKTAVIQRIFTEVRVAFGTQSIMVNPVFSAGDVSYTAVLSDHTGTIATLQGMGNAVVFEGLPNRTCEYTITLSSETSDTRQIAVQTVQAENCTAYLNRYADGWDEIAVLEVLDAAGIQQLRLTEDSIVNGQSSDIWIDEIDTLLQDAKIVHYVKADDGSIASLWFADRQQPTTFAAITVDDPEFPKDVPILYLRFLDDSEQTESLPPYLQTGYTYQMDVYQDAAIIRDMTYTMGSSTIKAFDAVVFPGLYEQSIECWAEFDTSGGQYTAQLWENGILTAEQTAAQGDTVVFEHLPAQAHTYTVRFFAEGSDTREMTVETAQVQFKSAIMGTIIAVESEEQDAIQMVASVMENGKLYTYAFHPDATLPDGSPVTKKQAARMAVSIAANDADIARHPVLFSLNRNQEITHIRYAEPVVITQTAQTEGRRDISYVMTLFNADTAQQQYAALCVAVYRGKELLSVRMYEKMPIEEDAVIADTIALEDAVQSDVPLTVKAIWIADLNSLHPLMVRDIK